MPEREVPVKDFIEEHRRLKGERGAPQPAQPSAQPPKPATPPASPQPPPQPAAPQPATMPQRVAQPVAPPASSLEPESQLSFVQLVERLKGLGYDVKALESLKAFTDLLDSEEQRLMREINERQERLKVVKEARRLLRALGL